MAVDVEWSAAELEALLHRVYGELSTIFEATAWSAVEQGWSGSGSAS